ncbi:uncharacterized protein LOC128674836 [Plodia interpunctella]|uniref:uncharacterized protein LOC128674836 n=1 Tax=Plodia interpunctella TaxID=58824 RepID=UPI0023688C91|nr:uncharacterized protein LOC128674836 [Plodia interpunctella]
MGCVCCSLSSFVSIVLDALERISLCTVCALLTCCLLFTILAVMVLGIGIGYHYCTVANSVESMAKAAKAAGALRSGGGPATPGHVMRSLDKAVKRGFAHRLSRREMNGTEVSNQNLNTTEVYNQNITRFIERLTPNITST